MDYSASVAEIGANAGADTWRAAVDDSPDYMLLDTDEKREAFRGHVRGFGGWDDAEIAAWSDVELNALFLQMIAGDMREAGLHAGMTAEEWQAYQEAAEAGRCASNICGGPLSTDGEIYYYLGN
ncbi:MAG: hypothetical protein B7Z31_00120 [Rhodobacterales bacterium 12-65-15]|nr:MAG: hypothetical protein B7Z31_00120 [Rhodobacterales bacterium 12-65-15]